MNTTLGTTEINDPARYAASSAWAGSASAVSWVPFLPVLQRQQRYR